jgi:hypothetical protein
VCPGRRFCVYLHFHISDSDTLSLLGMAETYILKG